MTTKSIVLTAVAAAGLVANAEVWDIKFSLKTVGNNKKTSVKIVGAYDDSTAGKYSFWYDKGAALKNVEFATDNVTSYGRSNKAQNAQLVWGDVSSPDGILIAGGFGSARSTSGQVAGVLDGVPASGTWTMKRSSKTFDALAKFQADTTANKEQEAKVAAFRKDASSFTKELAQLRENAEASAAEIADLEQQVADATKAKADAETAKKAAEATAKDAADKVAAAEAAATAAQADAAAAAAATNELQKALADLVAATNSLTDAVSYLNDVTNNEGLVNRIIDGYRADVTNYINLSVLKSAQAKADKLDKNVTNAMNTVSNELAVAEKDYNEAKDRYDNLLNYQAGTTNQITFAKDYTAELKNFETITNEVLCKTKKRELTTAEENALKKWKGDDGKGGSYGEYDAALKALEAAEEVLVTYTNNMAGAGKPKDAAYYAQVDTYKADIEKKQKAVDEKKKVSDEDKAKYDDATQQLKELLDETAKKKSEAKQKKLLEDFDAFIAECDELTNKALKEEIEAQNDTVTDLNKKVTDVKTKVAKYATGAGTAVNAKGYPNDAPYDQATWDKFYETESKNIKAITDRATDYDNDLATYESNINAWLNLATVVQMEETKLNDSTWVKTLQDKTFKTSLGKKAEAPVVVAAAAKWGISLKSTVK